MLKVKNKKSFRQIYFIMILVVSCLLIFSIYSDSQDKESDSSKSQTENTTKTMDKNGQPKHSLSKPSSPWVIVNKKRPLPQNYVPDLVNPNVPRTGSPASENMMLSPVASAKLEELFKQASKDGINIRFASGYRSASTQEGLYDSYVANDGQNNADKFSARPGHSEHQTGLAADIVSQTNYCFLEQCWGETKEGQWLANNAHKFGFVVRYLKDKQNITGYSYEPWHLRYFGKQLATELYNSKKTAEEYFNLEPAPNYN